MSAYDYDKQVWVHGAAGNELRLSQKEIDSRHEVAERYYAALREWNEVTWAMLEAAKRTVPSVIPDESIINPEDFRGDL